MDRSKIVYRDWDKIELSTRCRKVRGDVSSLIFVRSPTLAELFFAFRMFCARLSKLLVEGATLSRANFSLQRKQKRRPGAPPPILPTNETH